MIEYARLVGVALRRVPAASLHLEQGHPSWAWKMERKIDGKKDGWKK